MKALLKNLLAILGYELCPAPLAHKLSRSTDRFALETVAQNGLTINTVIDVGAAYGEWSSLARTIFPKARYILIEPLPQYDDWLNPLLTEFPNFSRIKAAAADHAGTLTFNLHEDWCGSSLLHEIEGPSVDGKPIEVKSITLDEAVKQHKLEGPFFIKLDVQGSENLVLSGATTILPQTACLLIETSMFEFYKNGPLIHDIFATMRQHDFVIYDILNLQYRLLDNALSQADLVFVPSDSPLRQYHIYASPDQRLQQNKRFIRDRNRNK